MDIFQALILGIIEGVTEFLPISSTGHMILYSSLLGQHSEVEKLFEVFIQLGAILSVVFLYPTKFFKFKGPTYGFKEIFICCLPVLVLGFLFHKKIKEVLFAPLPVAIALILGGALLIWVELRGKAEKSDDLKEVNSIGIKECIGIGLFQCLSLFPGFSRSGSCIIGGRLMRVNRVLAAEFSFIVAVPLMGVAVSYDMYKSSSGLDMSLFTPFAIGFFTAMITALFSIKAFIGYLSNNSLIAFGVYRIILGATVILYLS